MERKNVSLEEIKAQMEFCKRMYVYMVKEILQNYDWASEKEKRELMSIEYRAYSTAIHMLSHLDGSLDEHYKRLVADMKAYEEEMKKEIVGYYSWYFGKGENENGKA